jgi:hypothetical protein
VSVALGELVRREVGRAARRSASHADGARLALEDARQLSGELAALIALLKRAAGSGAVPSGDVELRVGRAFRVRSDDVDALLERASADSRSLATRRDVWTPTTTSLPRRSAQRTPGSVWEGADTELPAKRR